MVILVRSGSCLAFAALLLVYDVSRSILYNYLMVTVVQEIVP